MDLFDDIIEHQSAITATALIIAHNIPVFYAGADFHSTPRKMASPSHAFSTLEVALKMRGLYTSIRCGLDLILSGASSDFTLLKTKRCQLELTKPDSS